MHIAPYTLVASDPPQRGTARVTPPASLLVEHSTAQPFAAEELMAMLLEDALQLAAAQAGDKVRGLLRSSTRPTSNLLLLQTRGS
jgi:hypothetical protein